MQALAKPALEAKPDLQVLDDRIIEAFAAVLDVREGINRIDFAKTAIAIIQKGTITPKEYTDILDAIERVRITEEGKIRGSKLQKTPTYTKNVIAGQAGRGSYGVVHRSIAQFAYKTSNVANKDSFLKILTELFIQTVLASDPVFGGNISAPLEFNIITDAVGQLKTLIKMEFVSTTFDKYFHAMRDVTYEAIRPFMKYLVEVLKYFNDRYGFLHCDLHTQNIMFAGKTPDTLKLIDFGFATITVGGAVYSPSKSIKNTSDLILLCASMLDTYSERLDDGLQSFLTYLFNGTVQKGAGWQFDVEDGAEINGYNAVYSELQFHERLFHKFYYYEKYGNLSYIDYPYMHYDAILRLIDEYDTDVKMSALIEPDILASMANSVLAPSLVAAPVEHNALLYQLLGLVPPGAGVVPPAALESIPAAQKAPSKINKSNSSLGYPLLYQHQQRLAAIPEGNSLLSAAPAAAASPKPHKPILVSNPVMSTLYTGPTITESKMPAYISGLKRRAENKIGEAVNGASSTKKQALVTRRGGKAKIRSNRKKTRKQK